MAELAQVRIYDPALTNFSLSYANAREVYAADVLAPFTPSDDGGDTGQFFIADPLNSLRARDAHWSWTEGATRGMSRFTKGTWAAQPYAWEEGVPDAWVRNSQMVQGLRENAAKVCVDVVMLAREVRAEALADGVAPTTSLSSTAKWNSTAANPRADVKSMSTTILKKTAAEANAMILTGSVADSIMGTQSSGTAGAAIAEMVKYSREVMGGDINENLLAQYFNLGRVKFAKAIQSDATKYVNTTIPGAAGLAEAGTYVWDKDEAYVFRTEQGNQVVSYAQTFGSDYGTADTYYEPRTKTTVVRYCQTVVEKATCTGAIAVLGTIL